MRSVELAADVSASNRLLQLILFVPNLAHVKGLVWGPSADELILPPTDRRPALETLGVGGAFDEAAWTVDRWFNLAHLLRFESTATDVRPVLRSVLPVVPAAVGSLYLARFEPADVALVLSALAPRKQALTAVNWHPLWGRSREAAHEPPSLYTLLAKFPAVREFSYSVGDPTFDTFVPHPTVEVLRVGTASGSWDPWSTRGQLELANGKAYDVEHPLRRAVAAICSLAPARAVAGQAAHFPALRALGLCPRWSRPLDFSKPECRVVPGVRDMALTVMDAGLAFVDELGREWRAEWSSTVAPAPTTPTS